MQSVQAVSDTSSRDDSTDLLMQVQFIFQQHQIQIKKTVIDSKIIFMNQEL